MMPIPVGREGERGRTDVTWAAGTDRRLPQSDPNRQRLGSKVLEVHRHLINAGSDKVAGPLRVIEREKARATAEAARLNRQESVAASGRSTRCTLEAAW